MRTLLCTMLAVGTALFLLHPTAGDVSVAADEASIEDAILNEKCGLCHSSKRLLTMNPEQLKPVLERMQKKNPDWITEIDRNHIAKVLSELLGRPEILSVRKAWSEAVDRGSQLFGDASLGTNGKSCTDCHTRETMRQVADSYPQYDLKLRRIVSFEERVKLMVTGQLAGELQGASDQRVLDLIAYLKSQY